MLKDHRLEKIFYGPGKKVSNILRTDDIEGKIKRKSANETYERKEILLSKQS